MYKLQNTQIIFLTLSFIKSIHCNIIDKIKILQVLLNANYLLIIPKNKNKINYHITNKSSLLAYYIIILNFLFLGNVNLCHIIRFLNHKKKHNIFSLIDLNFKIQNTGPNTDPILYYYLTL